MIYILINDLHRENIVNLDLLKTALQSLLFQRLVED